MRNRVNVNTSALLVSLLNHGANGSHAKLQITLRRCHLLKADVSEINTRLQVGYRMLRYFLNAIPYEHFGGFHDSCNEITYVQRILSVTKDILQKLSY